MLYKKKKKKNIGELHDNENQLSHSKKNHRKKKKK